jgi:hypothetical protein
VHSRYRRRIHDQPVGGRRTVIDLKLRRFFCDADDCRKTTFAEQVTGLTARHARHSVGARQALTRIALAVGGRARTAAARKPAAGGRLPYRGRAYRICQAACTTAIMPRSSWSRMWQW